MTPSGESALRDQLQLLHEVSSALAPTMTTEEVAETVLDVVGTAVGSVSSSIWLMDPPGTNLLLAHARGAEAGALTRYTSMSIDLDLPGPRTVRTGHPVFITSRADRDQRWPALAGTPTRSESIAVLPLEVRSRRLGVIAFGFTNKRVFVEDERLTLRAIADQCAAALDRARLHDDLRAEAEGQEALARITATLAGNLDAHAVARSVANACVPALADICAVYLREGTALTRIAIAATDDRIALVGQHALPLDSPLPACETVRTGEPVRFGVLDPQDVAASAPDPAYKEIIDTLNICDGLALPLGPREAPFGSMTFVMTSTSRTFDDRLRQVAALVAERTAAAMAGARRFEDQHAAAVALHDVALPSTTPKIDGIEIASCYVSFQSETGIGGDWWDAFPLRDGSAGVAIGDVVGHGVDTTSMMGQLRHALRAFMIAGSTPADALISLSDLIAWDHPGAFATALVGAYDPRIGVFSWSSAGHFPPLLVGAGKDPRYLETSPEPPLGAAPHIQRRQVTVKERIDPGDALYLFTDGLIEGASKDVDVGMQRLIEAVLAQPIGPGTDVHKHCNDVAAAMGRNDADDVCLLVIRVPEK